MFPEGFDVEFFEGLFSNFQETLNTFRGLLLKDVPTLHYTLIIRTFVILFYSQ